MKRRIFNGGYIMRTEVTEVIRLKGQGRTITEISKSRRICRKTVRNYLYKYQASGLNYYQTIKLSDWEFKQIFQPNQSGRKSLKSELDFQQIDCELKLRAVSLMLLWEEYKEKDPGGLSYSQFAYHYKQWKKKSSPSMRQTHRVGEKVFVDYSGMTMPIYDEKTGEVLFEAEIFIGVLGCSNYTYAEATRSQKLENWIGSHVRMFEYFGGVPEIIVPDNLKSGVTTADFYDPVINKSYLDFSEHYNIAILPARVRKPKDKAKAENGVLQVQRRVLARFRHKKFYSLGELNEGIRRFLGKLNSREMKGYKKSRKELFISLDLPALKPLPEKKYIHAERKKAKVGVDYHIEYKSHYYSVPYQHVGEYVELKIYENTLEIYLNNTQIAVHILSDKIARHTTKSEHMPANHRYMQNWTPMRFLEWAAKIGPETKMQIHSALIQAKHPEQAYRRCLGILNLTKKHGNYKLEQACKKANDLGVLPVRSIKKIINNLGVDIEKKDFTPVLHSNIRGDTEFH